MTKQASRRVTHIRIKKTQGKREYTLFSKSARGTRYIVGQFTTRQAGKGDDELRKQVLTRLGEQS